MKLAASDEVLCAASLHSVLAATREVEPGLRVGHPVKPAPLLIARAAHAWPCSAVVPACWIAPGHSRDSGPDRE
jgi:hypothetical protein